MKILDFTKKHYPLISFFFDMGIILLVLMNIANESTIIGHNLDAIPIVVAICALLIPVGVVLLLVRLKIDAKQSGNSMSYLKLTVYPSTEKTILVEDDQEYRGAHRYSFIDSVGHRNGKPAYDFDGIQSIQFVRKNEDGSMTPGVQDEQLVLALIDRQTKLNAKFPSEQHLKKMEALYSFIEACQERIDDRMSRGVMGDMKK